MKSFSALMDEVKGNNGVADGGGRQMKYFNYINFFFSSSLCSFFSQKKKIYKKNPLILSKNEKKKT